MGEGDIYIKKYIHWKFIGSNYEGKLIQTIDNEDEGKTKD